MHSPYLTTVPEYGSPVTENGAKLLPNGIRSAGAVFAMVHMLPDVKPAGSKCAILTVTT